MLLHEIGLVVEFLKENNCQNIKAKLKPCKHVIASTILDLKFHFEQLSVSLFNLKFNLGSS